MLQDANPYESPLAVEAAEEPADEIRRPLAGTVLAVLWSLEGTVKTFFIGFFFFRGFNPFAGLAVEYRASNRLYFFLASAFFFVETIGPWIGVYYLTGRRARTIRFEKALVCIIKLAGGLALAAALILMIYLELTA